MDAGAREAYDAMAEAYVADEGNAYNALYERPAMVSALGDVAGRRVLDAGCGAGALAAELVARNAHVVGVDVSPRMIALARARGLGPRAEFVVGDLEGGVGLAGFADGSFDAAAASLVMHYVRDWEPVLRALARVVHGGGRIVLSTHHPAMVDAAWADGDPDAIELLHDRWQKAGATYDVRFWRRPLHAMLAAFADAGLEVEALVEPAPLPECRVVDPLAWERLSGRPWFLVVLLTVPGRRPAGRRPA